MIDLKQKLAERESLQLYRRRRTVDGPQGPEQTVDGKKYLSFCSNDYLGLANHPEIIAAFKKGADEYGVGSGAAHLVNGHTRAHQALEEELAEFTQRPRALLFSTGYMANLGTIAALVGSGDAVFEDRLNHASLLDAGLLSRARLSRYEHANIGSLENKIKESKAKEKLIVTDGVFSMDGDIAPLPELAAAAAQHKAMLMVDDAHAIGVLGPQGRGSAAHFGLGVEELPVLMGTLGKGVGTFGAFVAGSHDLIEWLIQAARPYIYTTATPPAVAEATRISLRIIQQDEWRREKLQNLIKRFRIGAEQLGLNLLKSETAIQPLLIGEAGQASALSQKLESAGILISAIRPPTVPDGTARLRITFSASHTEEQVDRLLTALESVA